MPAAQMTCPVCKNSIEVAETATSVSCPHCKKSFKRRPTGGSAASASRDSQPASAQAENADGVKTFGRFQLGRKLGAGAFGTVYLAHDPQLDRAVALKVPNPGTLTSARRVERFLREARAAANLRHPNIVPLFEAGQVDGNYYIASAFIRGKELADCIPEKGMDFREAAQIVRLLADAVAYAHDQGIVHRDIKPANVILDTKGQPHLMDFGLASRTDESEKLTHDGAVMGTPSYMAPEQARGQKGDAQPASDQYSLGILLYELLTGDTPFSGPPAAVLAAVLSQDPEAPSKRRKHLPRDLETICLKCLEKDPARRYADCHELSDDLRRWLEDEPIEARRLSPLERFTRWVSRNKLVAGLVLTTAMTLLGGVLVASYLAVVAASSAAEAVKNAAEAEKNAEEAKREAQRADEKTREAEASAALAQTEAAAARKAENAARLETERANTIRHAVQMQQANRAWTDGDIAELQRILQQVPPEARNSWEARHFTSLVNSSLREVQLVGGRPKMNFAVVSPDGKMLAGIFSRPGSMGPPSAFTPGKLLLWDLATAKERVLEGNLQGDSGAAAFSPDGKLLARGSEKAVVLHDRETGAQIKVLSEGVTGHVSALAYDPTGGLLAAGCADGKVLVWDREGTLKHTLDTKSTAHFPALCFSPDGKILAGCQGRPREGPSPGVHLWDTTTGKLNRQLGNVMIFGRGLCFSPDSRRIALGAFPFLRIVDVVTGVDTMPSITAGPGRFFMQVRFSPDGKELITGSANGTISWWDARTARHLRIDRGHAVDVLDIAFSPNGTISVDCETKARITTHHAAGEFRKLTVPGKYAVSWSPDGRALVTGGTRTAVIIDAVTGKDIATCTPPHLPTATLFVDQGRRVLLGNTRGEINVVDSSKGTLERTINTGHNQVSFLFLDPAKKTLVSAHNQGAINVLDYATGEKVGEFPPSTRVAAADLNSAFTTLALGKDNGTTQLWDVASKTLRGTLGSEQLGNFVRAVAFSPDGTLLAAGTGLQQQPGEIQIYEVSTGQVLSTCIGHSAEVTTVVFAPDGKTLISGGLDGTVRRWEPRSGQEILKGTVDDSGVAKVAVGPDGETLAIVPMSGGIRLWSAAPLNPR